MSEAGLTAALILIGWSSLWRTIAWTRPQDPGIGLTITKIIAEVVAIFTLFPLDSMASALAQLSILANGIIFLVRRRRSVAFYQLGSAFIFTLICFCLGWQDSAREWLRTIATPETAKVAGVFLGWTLMLYDSNVLIGLLFRAVGLTSSTERSAASDAEAAAGRYIGILERTLLYFFAITGSYGAGASVLAAKGFARYKEMDNRHFAEYVLIGTLLSSAIALGVGAIIRYLI